MGDSVLTVESSASAASAALAGGNGNGRLRLRLGRGREDLAVIAAMRPGPRREDALRAFAGFYRWDPSTLLMQRREALRRPRFVRPTVHRA